MAEQVAPLLQLRDVHAFYATAHVLFGVDLAVARGTTVALLGRNGAGKSTLLKSIMHVEARVTGSIRFQDLELQRLPTPRIAQAGVQLVPEDRRIYGGLTVRENLALGRQAARGRAPLDLEQILQIFPTLQPLLRRAGNALSGGEQQLVAIARALVTSPRLLLMDEPSAGLSPLIVAQVRDAIRTLRQTLGVTILLAEQNARFALQLAERVYLLDGGRVAFSGSQADFLADAALQQRYLAL